MTEPDFLATQSRKIAKAVLARDHFTVGKLLAELEAHDPRAAANVRMVLDVARQGDTR